MIEEENLCSNYDSASVLQFYRESSFFHRELNRICRQQKLDEFYLVRHVVNDLMVHLRKPLPLEDAGFLLTLYRGQRLHIFELKKLRNNVGEVVASTSFFSTTRNCEVAEIFGGDDFDADPSYVTVLFKIDLDTSQEMRPYAQIANSGEEEEVLLSPGIRFVLISCQKIHDNSHYWLIELQAISEKQDEQLELTNEESLLLLSSAKGWPVTVVIVLNQSPDETIEQGRNRSRPSIYI